MTKTRKNRILLLTFWFALMSCYLLIVQGCGKSILALEHSASTLSKLRQEATEIVRDGLADANPRIRVNAIEVVAVAGQLQLMPKVQGLIKDEFVPVRFATAVAIGDMEYRLGASSVRKLLKDPDENVRIAAAYAMAKLGETDGFVAVGKAIASTDQTVRANAALLLGKFDDKSILKLLEWAQHEDSSDYKVKLQAIEARARLGDERVFRKLWAIVFSSYADDRIMGIRAIGALASPKARDVLITKLDDDILEVRLAAAGQLGLLNDTAGVPEVLDVFEKNLTAGLHGEDLERVDVLTALAIGQIGTKSVTKFLPQFLKSKSKLVRIAAARAVFESTSSR